MPVISSGEIYQHNYPVNLTEEENTVLNQLASVFDNNESDLMLQRNSSDADHLHDATMLVMDIRKRWNEWSPGFREIAGNYFLSKSSGSVNQSSPLTLMRGTKAVRAGHQLTNWVVTSHFNIEWGNNLGDIDRGVDSDKILSCSDTLTDGTICAGIPDIVDKWAEFLEEVWLTEIDQLGYIKPTGTETYLYDVYIANSKDSIAGNGDDLTPALSYNYLGLTVTYCDKDFSQICKDDNNQESYSYIVVNRTYADEETMKITAAHELFHAIQFSYPSIDAWWFSTAEHWWIEATATWMEEVVYDEINHYYTRVQSWLKTPQLSLKNSGTSYSGHEYGDVIFILYLTDVYLKERDFVKDVWESDESGIDAISTVMGTDKYGNRKFESAFRGFVALNAVADIGEESGGYEEGYQYGRAVSVNKHVLYPAMSTVSGSNAPHELGASYIRFIPPDNDDNMLTIEFDGEANINWATMVVKIRSDGKGYEKEDLILDPVSGSGCSSIEGFGSVYNEVFLAASVYLQSDLVDTASYNYKADLGNSCSETPVQAYSVSENISETAANGNNNDKRCFIATVAFGSPDSPFVEILRDFRDQYLLTNRFGRRFVTLYYSISPSVADFLEQHPPTPLIVRYALYPVVGLTYLLLNITLHGIQSIAFFILISLSLTACKSLIRRQ